MVPARNRTEVHNGRVKLCLAALAFVLAAGNCVAQSASSPVESSGNSGRTKSSPASGEPPTHGTESTQKKPSSGNPTVDAILDRLEAKGKAIKGLGSKLVYTYVTVELVEDKQVKEGTLLFARGEPNAKFLIHFDKMTAGGVVNRRGEYFLFDGQWLTERNDRSKTIIRRQIARVGERKDPFELGKGPFPLPFGQKRKDILEQFTVSLEEFELGDPLHSVHLHCVPRPNTELEQKYSRVEIYVDRRLDMPIRIVTERLVDGNRIEVDFKEIDANEAPAGSRFQIEVPKDFTVTEEPLPASTSIEAAPGGAGGG